MTRNKLQTSLPNFPVYCKQIEGEQVFHNNKHKCQNISGAQSDAFRRGRTTFNESVAFSRLILVAALIFIFLSFHWTPIYLFSITTHYETRDWKRSFVICIFHFKTAGYRRLVQQSSITTEYVSQYSVLELPQLLQTSVQSKLRCPLRAMV